MGWYDLDAVLSRVELPEVAKRLGMNVAPMATSNSSAFDRSNSSRQDGLIISHLACRAQGARQPL